MNASSFCEQVEEKSAHRKKRIINFTKAVQLVSLQTNELDEVILAGLVFFYAQWEGHTKWLSQEAIKYIEEQKPITHKLVLTLQVIALLEGKPNDINEKTQLGLCVKFLEGIYNKESNNKLTYESAKNFILTFNANLGDKQLRKLFDDFSIKDNLHKYSSWLNQLVNKRNNIAHGDVDDINFNIKDFEEYGDRIIELIDWISTVFKNYIEEENFLLEIK